MTEEEWLTAMEWAQMLSFLRGKASDRKLRLFTVGCCWSLERALCDEAFHLLDMSERFADGEANAIELGDARRAAKTPFMANAPDHLHLRDEGSQSALRAAVLTAWGKVDADRAAEEVIHAVLYSRRRIGFRNAPSEFAGLLRDIFGNPFRPVTFEPRWRTSDVVGLARAIYDDRAFERMPILADALMDAGCEEEQIISHCRGDGPHVRGCWVVDLVLRKE